MSAEDIRSGISQPRNRRLAEIFHRLRLIESYGTGIRKIYAYYKKCVAQPSIEITQNTFKLVLPNMNVVSEKAEKTEEIRNAQKAVITPQMRTILEYLQEYNEMTDEELQELLNIKKTRSYLLARQMNEDGLIEIVGKGAGKKYKLKE